MSAAAELYGLDPSSRVALGALPVAIYTTDVDGRITFYNEAAARLWGHEPDLGTARWCAATKLIGLDGQVIAPQDSPVATALKTGTVVRAELLLERSDGGRCDITVHCTPLFDGHARINGSMIMLLDETEKRQAQRSQAQLSAIVESSDDAIMSKNLNGIIQTWNKGAERIFGYTADETVGQPVLMLIPQDRQHEEPGILARIRNGERIDHFETVRRRKDGSLFDISLTVSPVKNTRGEIIGASKIARDISEHKRVQEGRELLLHEIKHRVKNTLGTVQAIASQTFRAAPRAERDAFGARLRAMSEAHDLLTNQEWGQVAVTDVVTRAVAPFNPARFTLKGDAAELPATKALLLAMAVHELATNAVKYGALSNSDGKIAIDWRGENNKLVFRWRESGGPVVSQPTHQGFGSNLIQRAMAGEQGGAHFDYAPDGLRCSLEIAGDL